MQDARLLTHRPNVIGSYRGDTVQGVVAGIRVWAWYGAPIGPIPVHGQGVHVAAVGSIAYGPDVGRGERGYVIETGRWPTATPLGAVPVADTAASYRPDVIWRKRGDAICR